MLRGYIEGRCRDDAAWEAATEYRVWVFPRGFTVWRHLRIERLGLAVFYEVGAVAEEGFSLFRERVRQSYGVSGRFTLERAAIFRATTSDSRRMDSISRQASACPSEPYSIKQNETDHPCMLPLTEVDRSWVLFVL